MRAANLITFSLLLLTATPFVQLQAEDWPQFRGTNCAGISLSKHPLATTFSPTKNIAWEADLGDGIGCPVVAAGRVFVSSMLDAKTVALTGFDAKTGKQLWQRSWPTGTLVEIHKTNSQAATTPCADSERVYFYFSIMVVQSTTGEILWKEARDDMAVNYSHPVIVTTPKRTELVVAGTGKVVGYDIDNGNRLWESRTLLRNIKTTPVVNGNTIYISLQSGGIANQWLASIDRAETGNNDNRIDKAEIQAFVGAQKIPVAFYQRTFDTEESADEYILAIQAGGDGDVTKTHTQWKTNTKYTDHIVSPLVYDGRMLLIKGGGISTVYSLKKGKQLQGAKRIQNSSEYFASPIVGDNKVYMAGENGVIVVLDAADNFKLLAKNDMQDSILGTPAIADGSIFVRTRSKLYCIRLLK